MKVVGVDVASRRHEAYLEGARETIENERKAIGKWLRSLPEGVAVAIEATGGYGMLLAHLAHAQGRTIYIVNPRQISAYRKAIGLRAKTDRLDARLIADLVRENHEKLHPYEPMKEPWRTLRQLVRARAGLARDIARVRARLNGLGLSVLAAKATSSMQEVALRLEKRIAEHLKENEKAQALLEISGCGPMVAAGALCVLEHIPFRNADAFVAYMGLDLLVYDSGRKKGQRYLSRHGDKTLRWLFYMGAFGACNSKRWRDFYRKQKEVKGLKPTEALIVLARKLARAVFAVHRAHSEVALSKA